MSMQQTYLLIAGLLIIAGVFGLLYRVLGVSDPSIDNLIQDVVKTLVGVLVGRLSYNLPSGGNGNE